MRILILNWRDPQHPSAGGAEGYLRSVGRHWVEDGHEVHWICGRPGPAGSSASTPSDFELDGIRIHRRGRGYGVFPAAAVEVLRHHRGKTDVLVDSENGIPFFSPLYSRVPKIVLVHHVHQEVFHRELPPGAAHLGAFLEGRVMPPAYGRDYFVAVSESTRRDLLRLGVRDERLAMAHNGLDADRFRPAPKAERPTVVALGRLRRYKCFDTVIDAAALWRQRVPNLRLIVAGDGPERAFLEARARAAGLGEQVEFRGFVDLDEKVRLLGQAHVVVQSSMKEGWGMTVIEANACGTAVVAADVAGLRDSVRHEETGVLVPWNDPDALAGAVVGLVTDGERRRRLEAAALEWATRFRWRATADRWLEILEARLADGPVPTALRRDPHRTPSALDPGPRADAAPVGGRLSIPTADPPSPVEIYR